MCSHNVSVWCEQKLQVLPKTRGVVVDDGSSVAERLHQRIHLRGEGRGGEERGGEGREGGGEGRGGRGGGEERGEEGKEAVRGGRGTIIKAEEIPQHSFTFHHAWFCPHWSAVVGSNHY